MAIDPRVLRILEADNPWLAGERADGKARQAPQPFVPRHLRLEASPQRAALVIGPRQAGKSTLIWHHLRSEKVPALLLDCEEPSLRGWLRSPASVLADLEDLGTPTPILFFEEAQFLDDAGLFVKGLVDRQSGRRIFVTGSSSFHLEAATRESLAGRANRYLLLPFSLDELGGVMAGAGAVRNRRLDELVWRLAIYGSYPAVHLAQRPAEELAALVEAFVVRDVSDRFRIRETGAFRKVLQLAAGQIANLVSFAEWASIAGVSASTVREHCQLLEDTHILRLVRPWTGGKRAELTRQPKVFFLDNGVRNQLFGGFANLGERSDRGALIENFVFTEIAKTIHPLLDGLYFWRTKSGAEVDFVVERQGRIVGIEVKAGDVRGTVSRAARSFIEAYAPERFLVVSCAAHPGIEIEGVAVDFVPPRGIATAVASALASRGSAIQ